jgi:putative lipoprotein
MSSPQVDISGVTLRDHRPMLKSRAPWPGPLLRSWRSTLVSRRAPLLAASLLFILSGCASTRATPLPPARTVVSGSVSYLERIALTPEAVLHVEVVRREPGEDMPRVVGEQTLRSPGQVPIAFALTLTEPFNAEAGYAVRASITDGERLFTSRAAVPVLTWGNPSEDVNVRVNISAGRRPAR